MKLMVKFLSLMLVATGILLLNGQLAKAQSGSGHLDGSHSCDSVYVFAGQHICITITSLDCKDPGGHLGDPCGVYNGITGVEAADSCGYLSNPPYVSCWKGENSMVYICLDACIGSSADYQYAILDGDCSNGCP